jgi:hypothetical protein
MSLKPESARFFRISHPKPPAPITLVIVSFGTEKGESREVTISS